MHEYRVNSLLLSVFVVIMLEKFPSPALLVADILILIMASVGSCERTTDGSKAFTATTLT